MTQPAICKAVGVVTKATDDAEGDHGAFEVILSTPTADRDGEEVKAEEWELPLPDHITFDIDHGMSVTTTVGSGSPSIDDQGRLVVRGRYASTDLAQQTRALVSEGHITTTSVAFLRKTAEDGTVTRELLNGAFVAVPANPEAIVLASKALEQAPADRAAMEAAFKALAGSYEEREQAVYDAVRAAYTDYAADVYAWPIATFDDAVVFRISGGDESGTTWRAPYTISEDGTAALGDREKVVVSEVITTVAANSEESSSSAAKDADPAADAAGSASEDAETRDLDAERRAKALALGNLLAVQFGQ